MCPRHTLHPRRVRGEHRGPGSSPAVSMAAGRRATHPAGASPPRKPSEPRTHPTQPTAAPGSRKLPPAPIPHPLSSVSEGRVWKEHLLDARHEPGTVLGASFTTASCDAISLTLWVKRRGPRFTSLRPYPAGAPTGTHKVCLRRDGCPRHWGAIGPHCWNTQRLSDTDRVAHSQLFCL